jgi:phage-related protein
MLGHFIANEKSSEEFNVYISDAGVYGIAEKDVEAVSVKGRNGDLLIDNGRYKNKKMSYPAIIVEEFDKNFTALVNYLVSQQGYFKLQDSFHPDYYMFARYIGGTDPKRVVTDGKQGTFVLEFERKPQKYMVEGDEIKTFTSNSATLYSEYNHEAKPLIRAYGTGTFTINGVSLQITSASSYTDIDCELEECYKDTLATNCNGNVVLTNNKFPSLKMGANTITKSGITKLEIKPRWWIV